jgi:hypothetical protein
MVKNYLPSIPITVPGRNTRITLGQTGTGRYDERKPVQNNLFEEEDD